MERYVGWCCILNFYAIIPTLFLCFLLICYPYTSLHFLMFFILVLYIDWYYFVERYLFWIIRRLTMSVRSAWMTYLVVAWKPFHLHVIYKLFRWQMNSLNVNWKLEQGRVFCLERHCSQRTATKWLTMYPPTHPHTHSRVLRGGRFPQMYRLPPKIKIVPTEVCTHPTHAPPSVLLDIHIVYVQ